MKRVLLFFAAASLMAQPPVNPAAPRAVSGNGLIQVKRIYVGALVGTQADALRELIIASLNSTGLFTLTDNADRADAVLKGAADDHAFTDTFDSEESINTRQSAGKYGSGLSSSSRSGGGYGGISAGENESHHIKERKHEAYAAVRLCSKEGDVLWSTTQESSGAKFRSASADVASKVARQLMLDMARQRREQSPSPLLP